MQLAFYHGRLAVARILLNRKAQLEATDINGMTACHFAVDANQLELLRFALENGANVNAADACGWSLLSRAGEYSSRSRRLRKAVAAHLHLQFAIYSCYGR